MDRLERDLRNTLADDRLSLPVRRDAVELLEAGVRRRRRSRAIASASAAAVLLAGGVTAVALATHRGSGPELIYGPAGSPTPTTAVKPPLPKPTRDEVRWTSDAYDYHQPPAFPGAIADLSVPWCRADQLTLSQSFQGETGSWAGVVTVTNDAATTCAIQGQPAVSMAAADGRVLITSHPEPFFVDAWVPLSPGKDATAFVVWYPELCNEPAPAIVLVDLPHAGGRLSTAMRGGPRCDVSTTVPSTGRLDVDGFERTQGSPFTPEAGLSAGVDRADASVAPGAVLDYRLQLQSMDAPSVALNPCLPYRERLVDHATQKVLIEEDHLLNCGDTGDITDPQSRHETFFDLELAVPMKAPAGDYDLVWQSVLKPVAAVGTELVHVTQPVPPCRDGQVTASAGGQGAGLGSYYDVVVFRNMSATTCSLFGYPGVTLTDGNGAPAPTKLQRDPSTPRLVVLAPGAAASATISGADSGPNGGATPCKPSAGVLVIAPGQRRQTLVRGIGMRCYDTISVWPVVAGTRGSLGG